MKIIRRPDIFELGGRWRLTKDILVINWTDDPNDLFISDPFIITDYGSVPSWKLVILFSALISLAIAHYVNPIPAVAFFAFCIWIRDLVDPNKFKMAALAHDILCTRSSRVVADGFLHKLVRNDGMPYIGATIIFVSVRIGAIFKYKTVVPDPVKNKAKKALAEHLGISVQKISFDKKKSRLLVEPAYKYHNENNSSNAPCH